MMNELLNVILGGIVGVIAAKVTIINKAQMKNSELKLINESQTKEIEKQLNRVSRVEGQLERERKQHQEVLKIKTMENMQLQSKGTNLEYDLAIQKQINGNQVNTIESQRLRIEELEDTIILLKESEADLSREISYYKGKYLPFTETPLTEAPRHILEEMGLLK